MKTHSVTTRLSFGRQRPGTQFARHIQQCRMIPQNDLIPVLLKLISDWVSDLQSKHRMDSIDIPDFVTPPLRTTYELVGNYPVPFNQQ